MYVNAVLQGTNNAGSATAGAADAPSPRNRPHSTAFSYSGSGKTSAQPALASRSCCVPGKRGAVHVAEEGSGDSKCLLVPVTDVPVLP